jgi:hypothetical protein
MARPSKRKMGSIGRVIDQWRQANHPTMSFATCCTKLAKHANVTTKAVETWCYNVHKPKASNYTSIASFFNRSEADLNAAIACEDESDNKYHLPERSLADGVLDTNRMPSTADIRVCPSTAIELSDISLVIRPDSLLKPIEYTLRKSILDLPYFKLFHDVRYSYEWDPQGYVRIYDQSKYALQNRLNRIIDYNLFVGLWNVRGKLLDNNSAVATRIACRCPNLPDEPLLNFEYLRSAEIETYERLTRWDVDIRIPIKLPPHEIIEVETEGIVCAYPIDHEPIIHFAPTGKFSVTVDISRCPGLIVHAAPLHPLEEYFRSIPNQEENIFGWEITTGLLPLQGILLSWEGSPPEGIITRLIDRR